MRATSWWDRRVTGAFMAYVLYQHWGNLHPDALEAQDIYAARARERGRAARSSPTTRFKSDREIEGARWSYCRDIGRARGS